MGRKSASGEQSKKRILLQSFILFSNKPYDRVTFDDIENAIGMSRGAILYHYPNKQAIFNAVVEKILLAHPPFLELEIKGKNPLENFIIDFTKGKKIAIRELAMLGLKNINRVYFNIECEALFHYESYVEKANLMRVSELKKWTQVINKAKENNEIRKNVKPEELAKLFLNAYYGHVSSASKEERYFDVHILQKELMFIREAYLI